MNVEVVRVAIGQGTGLFPPLPRVLQLHQDPGALIGGGRHLDAGSQQVRQIGPAEGEINVVPLEAGPHLTVDLNRGFPELPRRPPGRFGLQQFQLFPQYPEFGLQLLLGHGPGSVLHGAGYLGLLPGSQRLLEHLKLPLQLEPALPHGFLQAPQLLQLLLGHGLGNTFYLSGQPLLGSQRLLEHLKLLVELAPVLPHGSLQASQLLQLRPGRGLGNTLCFPGQFRLGSQRLLEHLKLALQLEPASLRRFLQGPQLLQLPPEPALGGILQLVQFLRFGAQRLLEHLKLPVQLLPAALHFFPQLAHLFEHLSGRLCPCRSPGQQADQQHGPTDKEFSLVHFAPLTFPEAMEFM